MSVLISISNGCIKLDKKAILGHLNWRIKANEHWLIKGPNGAGKTVLLELLAGQHSLSDGHIEYSFIDGSTWDERHAQKKRLIAYVPARAFQTIFKGSQHLFYQQRYYASGNEEVQEVRDYLNCTNEQIQHLQLPANFNIHQLLHLKVTNLSNGQLKKLIIVKALLSTPRFLLLDYPYEGLDADSRTELNDFLNYITHEHGIQLIMVDNHYNPPSVINQTLVLNEASVNDLVETNISVENKAISSTSSSSEPCISLNNVSVKYGSTILLSAFNWQVNKGEKWALLGKNGSGKTTLLSLIFADHPQAYHNNIYLFGKKRGSGESIWDIKSRMSCLLPEMFTYSYLPSTRQTVAYDFIRKGNATPYKKQVDDEQAVNKRIDVYFDYFQLNHLKNKRLIHLSSGEIQMLLFIKTFVCQRDIVLLDEPFQFLDARQKTLAKRFIKQHLSDETTLIMITHEPDDIDGLITQIKQI